MILRTVPLVRLFNNLVESGLARIWRRHNRFAISRARRPWEPNPKPKVSSTEVQIPGLSIHFFDQYWFIRNGWWARPDLDRSLCVPNAQGWTMLPHEPISFSRVYRTNTMWTINPSNRRFEHGPNYYFDWECGYHSTENEVRSGISWMRMHFS